MRVFLCEMNINHSMDIGEEREFGRLYLQMGPD
jgi:hypothetical protein